MKHLIAEYLADHKQAWAETTMKSETCRLKVLEPHLDLDPKALYKLLTEMGKSNYTIKITFTRICALEAWGAKNKKLPATPFKAYIEKHKNQFKHAYVKEELNLTFEEARTRIQQLREPYRTMAQGILETGLRISEVYKVQKGKVIGKGGKPRQVYGKIEATAPRSTFSRELKSVGLKAHMLRKLCATRLAEKGASPADLCKIFGWSSITTSYQYLQPREDKKLRAFVEESIKGE